MDSWKRFELACKLMDATTPAKGNETIIVNVKGNHGDEQVDIKLAYYPDNDSFVVGWDTSGLPLPGDYFFSNEGVALKVLATYWSIAPEDIDRETVTEVFRRLRALGLSDKEILALADNYSNQPWAPKELIPRL